MEQGYDPDILIKLKNGDHQAYTLLFENHWKMVFNMAYKKLGDEHVALDITQEIFTSIWERRARLTLNGPVGPWLAGMVKYKVIDWYRNSQKLELQKEQLSINSSPNNTSVQPPYLSSYYNKTYSYWLQIIEQLPERMKEIYLLSNMEGRSVTEIADLLSLKPQSVKNHLGKANIRIRKEMKTYLEDTLPVILVANTLLPALFGNN